MDEIIALAKRRGFFYPSSEIYGGLANTWDFGHYGVLLKNNLRDWWLKKIVLERDDIVLVDSSVILNPKVWQASGHVTGFNDALVECKKCHNRTRADHLIEDKLKRKVEGLPVEELTKIIKDNQLKCPRCGSVDLTDAKRFNLL
ncbi:glycine--tRNA ligase, partial [Patescibacteria group bacterium]|nr:glycine--tRNA ligase [Patescibacteria group bacterium]